MSQERDEKARQSVNRDLLDLIEADARERHFKLGWNEALKSNLILELVDALKFYASEAPHLSKLKLPEEQVSAYWNNNNNIAEVQFTRIYPAKEALTKYHKINE